MCAGSDARHIGDVSKHPGELCGAVVRARGTRGRLRSVRFDPSFDWSDVTTLRAGQLASNRVVLGGGDEGQRILADKELRHPDEPIVLLACADQTKLERARLAVHVDLEEQAEPREVRVLQRWVVGHDEETIAAALASCARVVRGSYSTQLQAQLRLAPQGVLSWWDDAGVHVVGEVQARLGTTLAQALGVADERVTLVALGASDARDPPALLALYAALLARESGRPVRLLEELVPTISRQPSAGRDQRAEPATIMEPTRPCVCEIVSGCDEDGTLRALDVRLTLELDGYGGLAPEALSRAVQHAVGAYRWPSVRINALALTTDLTPAATRGGLHAAHMQWAIERHLDAVARALGVDPLLLRRQNLVAPGDSAATGQRLRSSAAAACLELAMNEGHYHARKAAIEAHNARRAAAGSRKRRGLGGSVALRSIDDGASCAFVCEVAEVEVDLDSFEVDVLTLHLAAHAGEGSGLEAGAAAAQLERGAMHAVGWALCEELVREDGARVGAAALLPTALDAPRFHTRMIEHPREATAAGAHAEVLCELGTAGAAPAIAAAVEHAVGIAAQHLPLSPERLLAASRCDRDARQSCGLPCQSEAQELVEC